MTDSDFNELKRIKAKRGRPPIDLATRRLIAEKATEDRDRPRKELASELGTLFKQKGLRVPPLETLKKKISEARRKSLPLDQPFTLGALVQNPIPAENLSMVMQVWASQTGEEDGDTWDSDFSIRDALWVSRLSHLFKDDPETIWGYAVWYSARERAYEAIGEEIDTADLDTELIKNFKPSPKKKGSEKNKEDN